jgi:hypothetical protein
MTHRVGLIGASEMSVVDDRGGAAEVFLFNSRRRAALLMRRPRELRSSSAPMLCQKPQPDEVKGGPPKLQEGTVRRWQQCFSEPNGSIAFS